MSNYSRDDVPYSMRFQCPLCCKVDRLSTAPRGCPWYNPQYFVTNCCNSLACDCCVKSNIARHDTFFKCMICSRETSICEKFKDGGHDSSNRWNRDSCAFSNYHGSLMYGGLILLIPFTAKKQFGTWRELAKIVFRSPSCRFVHPDYEKCIQAYSIFEKNFNAKQNLFYLFRSSRLLRKLKHSALICRTFDSSPMLEFFDTQKCYLSLVSRKLFLKQNQLGFVILIIERLSVLNFFSVNKILHAFLY